MNELKIDIFPENTPRPFEDKSQPVSNLITEETVTHSFEQDPEMKLDHIDSNVPTLLGIYEAHIYHLPLRIKPDDIWLLIIQAFSKHVNDNSEKLRKYFVNFYDKKKIEVMFEGAYSINGINKDIIEDITLKINKKMEDYLDKELLETLTPNFSTTDHNTTLICKMCIMGVFQKYFYYSGWGITCGIPYIILEGTSEDYKKILEKAKKLAKYEFQWYTDGIYEPLQKMIDAKENNVDIDYFKRIVKREYVPSVLCGVSDKDYISGWIAKFFAYCKLVYNYNNGIEDYEVVDEFDILDLDKIPGQISFIPFNIKFGDCADNSSVEYPMYYRVGFIGCKRNEKNEVSLVPGWFIDHHKPDQNFSSIPERNRSRWVFDQKYSDQEFPSNNENNVIKKEFDQENVATDEKSKKKTAKVLFKDMIKKIKNFKHCTQ